MYSWLVERVLQTLIGRLNAGDTRLLMRTVASDALLVFPGSSSFAGEHRGKPAIEAWFKRFVELRPSFVIDDVAVTGPPWNMRVCFRFTDRIEIPAGGEYNNEGMEYLRMRWGMLQEQRVYLDTERVAQLDAQLAAAGDAVSTAASASAG